VLAVGVHQLPRLCCLLLSCCLIAGPALHMPGSWRGAGAADAAAW
jgi:hypothetical protein